MDYPFKSVEEIQEALDSRTEGLVSFLDTGTKLRFGELLTARFNPRSHNAPGGHKLYNIDPGFDLFASGFPDLIRAIGFQTNLPAVSAGHAD